MSDHEFEKQVRQKLDDLRLTPSGGSWQKIEDGLRAGKRRPAAVYWLTPLVLIGLLAGGYFLTNNQKEDTSMAAVHTQTTVQPAVPLKERTSAPAEKRSSVTNQAADDKKNFTQQQSNAPANKIASNNKVSSDKTISGKLNDPALQSKSFDEDVTPTAAVTSAQTKNQVALNRLHFKQRVSAKSGNDQQPANDGGQLSLSYYSKLQSPLTGSLNKPLSKEMFNTTNSLNLSPTTAIKLPVSKKWSFGIRASAGVSAVNEGNFLDFNKATVEDVAYRAFGYAPSYTPSRLTPAFTYSAGVIAKRQLTKKLALTIGLNYLQRNTKNKVGAKVYAPQVVNNGMNSYLNVSNYYMLERDRPTDYLNKYHYLEIPVGLNTRLNKSQKLPVYWNVGLAYARLLSSNSLHFDGTTGVYYKNDKLLNRNQLAFTTGVSFRVLNKTKYPLLIGPSARYNVTKMLDKNVSANKAFMTLGLDLKLYIW